MTNYTHTNLSNLDINLSINAKIYPKTEQKIHVKWASKLSVILDRSRDRL